MKMASNFAGLGVALNSSLDFNIFIHDPEFFFMTGNPKAFQGIIQMLKSEDHIERFVIPKIEVIKHKKLNQPVNIYETKNNYSLTLCIKKSIMSKIGCKLLLGGLESELPEYTVIDQFKAYEKLYNFIAASEQKEVQNMTGCMPPCNYREFQEVGNTIEMKFSGSGFGFGLCLVTTDVQVETEELVYPFNSFKAEFGGALGLFLGFSFIMIWDFVFYLFKAVQKTKWLQ